MKPRPLLIAALLFGSGCAALLYQTVWFRELRLIFGSSTAAVAAVTVVFMGGLGVGSWILGERVERQSLGIVERPFSRETRAMLRSDGRSASQPGRRRPRFLPIARTGGAIGESVVEGVTV